MKNITQKNIENFKKYLQNEERAAATTEKYIRDISAFSVRLDGKGIDKSIVLAYKEHLIEYYAPASVILFCHRSTVFFGLWDGMIAT